MIRLSVALIAGVFFSSVHNKAIAAIDPFVERNGKLVVEVESVPVDGDWLLQNDIYGHTGSDYLVWRGQNNYAKSQASRGNPIQYHFNITTPGNYQMQWRSRNTIGMDATEHNDSWVRFPSGTNIDGQYSLNGWTKAYMGQVAQWTWDAYTVDSDNQPIRQYFEAGDHVMEIAGRSFGHALDRFVLFRYESDEFSVAEFDALPQSPRVSQLSQTGHAFTGNSCVGTSLSLSASQVRSSMPSVADPSNPEDIVIDGASGYAFLKFDTPIDLSANTSVLKIGKSEMNLPTLSVYLGSHNNWNELSGEQNLPDPATLLGTLVGDPNENTLASLHINNPIVQGEYVTIVVEAMSDTVARIFGTGSPSEPRLEIRVPADYCANYNLRRISTFDSTSVETNLSSGNNTDDQDDSATNTNTDSSGNGEQTHAIASGDDGPISTSADKEGAEAPMQVLDNENRTSIGETEAKPSRKRKFGGSVSLWTLLIFAFSAVPGFVRRLKI